MNVFTIRQVMKGYSDELALSSISFSVQQGEFLAIVGPSGSGKTTLLNILGGLMNPDSGKVLFKDEEMEGPDIRLVPGYEEIKVVRQDLDLRLKISVEDNIRDALLGYNDDFKEEKTAILLDFFSLTPFRKKRPSQLSGGQRQRLVIARAMASEPEVLLLDEPFSALDVINSSLALSEIKSLAAETNTTVVLVTHQPQDALQADRILVLQEGEVQQLGRVEEIYQTPASVEVAKLFGPINIFSPEEFQQHFPDQPLNSKSIVGVRPEDIIFEQKPGASLIVEDVTFMGSHYLLKLKSTFGKEIMTYDFQKRCEEGDQVSIELKNDHGMSF
ncbi:MAG: ABC transporter ATP-binding protein [Cyclobacteriaceae bacterium]|nr:ABC transporter ATP-binding protein [Cyclobacteriaceae bacterium HetDA_MAG_MS6]